jgi:hypothetical protein
MQVEHDIWLISMSSSTANPFAAVMVRIPHQTLDALWMGFASPFHPLSSERYKLLYIPLERLGVGIPEVRGYIAEELDAQIRDGGRSLGR